MPSSLEKPSHIQLTNIASVPGTVASCYAAGDATQGGCYTGQERGDAVKSLPEHPLLVFCSCPGWSDKQRGCCRARGMESTELQQNRQQKKRCCKQPYRSLLSINLPHVILSSVQISKSPGAVWVGVRGWGNPFLAPWGAGAQRGVFCLLSAAAGLG